MRLIFLFLILISGSLTAQTPNEYITVERTRTRVGGYYWVEQGAATIAGLSPYLWMDASSATFFKDTSGNTFTCTPNATHTVQTWLDRSGNNRNFTSATSDVSPTYTCDSQSTPLYQRDNFIQSDGIDDIMTFNFSTASAGVIDGLSGTIDSDFTFIFVMQATASLGYNDSFIASGDGWNTAKNWQIGATGTDRSKIYFRLAQATPTNLALIPFDTNTHVYLITRSGTTVTYKVDGTQVASITYPANRLPFLDNLKLFTNRATQTRINARFSEFFVFNGTLTADQEFIIEQYLLSKWGV
ncbi:MAG: hypothetical protein ACK5NB_00010 [Flavobacteriaceae bacterium]